MTDNKERTSEEPLMLEDKIEENDSEWLRLAGHRSNPQRNFVFWLITVLPWILLVLLSSWDLVQYHKREASKNFDPSQQIYSQFNLPNKSMNSTEMLLGPVQDLIEYEVRTFYAGLGDDGSPYVGEPSSELDEAWLGLYPSIILDRCPINLF